ncbi:hypothetical protein WDU94_003063 [Cyamophila willieti]
MSDAWTSSLCTATEEDIESWVSGDWWDADYIQHWLRLDESAGGVPQQYDRAELEDWTMRGEDEGCLSPSRSDRLLISPSTYDSWSSSSTSDNSCSIDSLANSSTLGCPGGGHPDLTSSTHTLGVDFTRDFYRLVKFESTKSLSSTCSTNRDGEGSGIAATLSKTNIISSEDPSSSRKRTGSSVEQGGPTNPFNQHSKLLRLEDDSTSGDGTTQHQELPNLLTVELPIRTEDTEDDAQYHHGKQSIDSGVFSNQESEFRDSTKPGHLGEISRVHGSRERGCENVLETSNSDENHQRYQKFLLAHCEKDCDTCTSGGELSNEPLDRYEYHIGTSQSYADSQRKHELHLDRSTTTHGKDTVNRNHATKCSQYVEDITAHNSQNVIKDSKETTRNVSICRQDMADTSQKTNKDYNKASTSKDPSDLTNVSNREPIDSRISHKDLVKCKLPHTSRNYKHIVSGGALLRNGELPYELLNSGVDAYENNPAPTKDHDRDYQTKDTPLQQYQHEHMKYLTNGGLLPKSEGGIGNIKTGSLIHAYENIKLFTGLPQYESHNVDQLYGNVKWESSNVDQLYGNVQWNDETCDNYDMMKKKTDRMFSEIKEKERDKEEEEEEGEIECLAEDFSYELSSRGVSRNGLRTELNTVIEENEDEESAAGPCPSSSPCTVPCLPIGQPSNLSQSNISQCDNTREPLSSDLMTRSLTSSTSTPDTVVNIHDTRQLVNDTRTSVNYTNPLVDNPRSSATLLVNDTRPKVNSSSDIHPISDIRTPQPSNNSHNGSNQTSSAQSKHEECQRDMRDPTPTNQRVIEPVESTNHLDNSRTLRDNTVIASDKITTNGTTIRDENGTLSNYNDVRSSTIENLINGQLNSSHNYLMERQAQNAHNYVNIQEINATSSSSDNSTNYANIEEIKATSNSRQDINAPNYSNIHVCNDSGIVPNYRNVQVNGTTSNGILSNYSNVQVNGTTPNGILPNYSNVQVNGTTSNGILPNFTDGRTTSKQVIDELNRLIQSDEMLHNCNNCCSQENSCSKHEKSNEFCCSGKENSVGLSNGISCSRVTHSTSRSGSSSQHSSSCKSANSQCDGSNSCNGYIGCRNGSSSSCSQYTGSDGGSCCNTGWIHVEKHIDLADPKARANLLDVMLSSSRSSSTSSSEEEMERTEGVEGVDYYHLHALHRFRRHKKAAHREPLGGALRFHSSFRPSIIGRDDFYVRYGEKEREAVASFDFLEGLSTASSSRCTLTSGDEDNEKVTEL